MINHDVDVDCLQIIFSVMVPCSLLCVMHIIVTSLDIAIISWTIGNQLLLKCI